MPEFHRHILWYDNIFAYCTFWESSLSNAVCIVSGCIQLGTSQCSSGIISTKIIQAKKDVIPYFVSASVNEVVIRLNLSVKGSSLKNIHGYLNLRLKVCSNSLILCAISSNSLFLTNAIIAAFPCARSSSEGYINPWCCGDARYSLYFLVAFTRSCSGGRRQFIFR